MNHEDLKYRFAIRSTDIMTCAERTVIEFVRDQMDDYPDVMAALSAVYGRFVQVFPVPGKAINFVNRNRRDISEMLGHECRVSGMSPVEILSKVGEVSDLDPLMTEPHSMVVLAQWAVSVAAASLIDWLMNISEADDPMYREAEHAADMLASATVPDGDDAISSVQFDWDKGFALAGNPDTMAMVTAGRHFLEAMWKTLTTETPPSSGLSAVKAGGATLEASSSLVNQITTTLGWVKTVDGDSTPTMSTLSSRGQVLVENSLMLRDAVPWNLCAEPVTGVCSRFDTENATYELLSKSVR